jgi:hypothetical protein
MLWEAAPKARMRSRTLKRMLVEQFFPLTFHLSGSTPG